MFLNCTGLKTWDKCERLQQGLIQAFVSYNWPAAALLACASDGEALAALKKSARKVDGGRKIFEELTERIHNGDIVLSDEQESALR